MSLITDQTETPSTRFPIRPSQLPIPAGDENETSAPQTAPTRTTAPLATHTGGGRHFSSVTPPELIAGTNATRHQFNEAIEQMRRDNPLLTVPTKYRAKVWPLIPLVALLNYVIPTRYMRFFWGGIWFTIYVWLRGKNRRPPAPYLPQPSHRARMARAGQKAQNILFNSGKVIACFHLGGGVGKTTHSGRLGLQIKQLRPDLNVDIIDCEEGTLIQRFTRNTVNSFLDFLNNLKEGQINKPGDLARYRSITPGGAHVIAWRREDQTRGVRDVKRQEMVDGIGRFALFSNIVICDMPGGSGPKNRGVLDATHQVQLVTIPADDRLDQAVAAFTWLMENGYEHLARTAVVVVNKCRSHADIEKVRARFYESYPADTKEVRFQPFGQSRDLLKGSKIVLKKFSRFNRAQYAEYATTLLEELADGHRDDNDSMMTHLEIIEKGDKIEQPLRSPHVGHATPSNDDNPSECPKE